MSIAAKRAVVDEFGEVERQFQLWRPPAQPVNPHAKRYAELEAEILTWSPDLPAAEGEVIRGKRYQVSISARGWQSVVTAAVRRAAFGVMEAVKDCDPFAFFNVSISDMKAQCGSDFVKVHVKKAQTGPRTISVVAIASVPLKKTA
jgi:hypothetical protein